MSYKDIYGSIASQRSKLTSSSSRIKQERKKIQTAKQSLSKAQRQIQQQRYKSPASFLQNQPTKRKLQKESKKIQKYKSDLTVAEKEIESAYPKLKDYEKKIKEYEQKGFKVRENNGKLEFYTTVTETRRAEPRKVSMTVKYRKAGSSQVRSVGCHNTNVNSIINSLQRNGNIILEVRAEGNLDRNRTSSGVIYKRDVVQTTTPVVKVETKDTTTVLPAVNIPFSVKTTSPYEKYQSIADIKSEYVYEPDPVMTRLSKGTTAVESDLPISASYYTKDPSVSLDTAMDKAKKYQADRFPSVVTDTFKGTPVSLSDIQDRFNISDQQIITTRTTLSNQLTKIDADVTTVKEAEFGVFTFTDSSGKTTEMDRSGAISYLLGEKRKTQKQIQELDKASDELKASNTKSINLAQDLYDKGYRAYEKDDELLWYKEEPSTKAMKKAEGIMDNMGLAELGAFWSSGVLSSRDPLRLKSLIGSATGILSKKDITRDVAFDVEKLDTSLDQGAINYLATAYTSPFAVAGFSVGIGYGIGSVSGTIAGRLAYTSPTLAKGFIVGETAIGMAYLGGEAINVGNAFKTSASEGLTALTTTGLRVAGGLFGYKYGREAGFARGTRMGYRAEVKRGDLFVHDSAKNETFLLESGQGKPYRKFLLQREKAIWKLEKQGLFKVKTDQQHPVNIDTVETMAPQKTGVKKFVPKFMQKYKSELFGSASEKPQFAKVPEGSSHDLDIGFKRYVRSSDMWDYSMSKFKIKDQLADIKPLPKQGELVTPFGGRKQAGIKGYELTIGGKTYRSDYQLMPLRESGIRHAHSSLDLAHVGRVKDIGRTTDIAGELYTHGVKTGQISSFKAYRMKKNLDFLIESNPTYEAYPKIMDPARAEMFYTTDPLPSKSDIPDLIYKNIAPAKFQTRVNKYTFGKIKGTKLSGIGSSKTKTSFPNTLSKEYVSLGKGSTIKPATIIGKKTQAGKRLWGKSESFSSTVSVSHSPKFSTSFMASKSVSPSRSISPSISSVTSPSISKSISRSKSISPSPSLSISISPSPSSSFISSPSPSPSPSPYPSYSISPSPSP